MDKGSNFSKLNTANNEIAFLNQEKDSRAKELTTAYKELAFQIEERGKRAAELAIANVELMFQNEEKEKRAAELIVSNEELIFQNQEKEKRAAELVIANIELLFQNEEKEKRAAELQTANRELQKAEAAVRILNSELEKKVIKRSAQYAFLSEVNQTIVHVKDAKTLFRKLCTIALKFGKFKFAWIGSYDVSHTQIKLLDFSGIPSEDIDLFRDLSNEVKEPQEYVLGAGTHFVSNNISDTPELQNWRSFAIKHTVQSCIVLPIKKAGKVFGTFNLFASELNFFDDVNLKVALEVAGDISFALDLFEKAQRHEESELLILKNENRFRALIEKSSDMETLTSEKGHFFYASPSISKVLGHKLEDFLIMSLYDIIHADDIPGVLENVQKILKTTGGSFHIQLRLKHKNGHYVWSEGSITNMLDEPHVHAIVSNFRDISVQKAIEIQHEFDNGNLNALINCTNDLMWSVDKDFNLITSNQPFDEAGIASFGKAIAKGENVLSEPHTPEMLSWFKGLYERALEGESFTEIVHLRDPAELWTQISYYPIRVGDSVIGTACHSRDITSIKRIEQQLSNSEEFNRGILNSLNSNIAVIDVTGKLVAVNDSWKTFARENGDVKLQSTGLSSNYFKVCSEAAAAGDMTAHAVLVGMQGILDKKHDHFYLEYPCHSPYEKCWYGMRAIKFESDASMIVVAHINITERKFAEDKLLYSEARLKEAQALTHISNWEVDLVNKTSTWSDEFFSIFGVSRQEEKSSPKMFLSMLHPDDFNSAKAKIKQAFQAFDACSYHARIINRNGDVRYIYTQYKFEFDNNLKPTRLYGILQDITERKIAEEERERLTNEMIQRNRDLEQFTFIISHNLRAPTANIIGLVDILQDKSLAPEIQEDLLKSLLTSATGLDTIVKDINSILQVKHQVNDKKEFLSFTKLVENISISNKNIIDKNQVRIKTDFSAIDEIFSLKVYLHSIFYNLISNSIKYSRPAVPPIIEIKSKKDGNKIFLTFKDNGLGIDMKNTGDKVFGLYKRFHSHVEGKGLGLFMVKTQVEAIGGRITVASELNEGTEFTIVFEV